MPADQMPSARHAASVVAILMVLAGGAALAYARWTAPIAEGDRAVADGQLDRALAAYARAEARFDRLPPATRLAAELRKQPKTPPNQLMQLLRPQPKAGARPARRVG